MNKSTILVVEDEALIAANLAHTLSSLGYTVQKPVATGEDAIRSVTTQQPDLVLMDIELAGVMNGIDAAEKIRAIAEIPIVYLTAYTDDLRLKQAQFTDPYGYLVKPAHSRELHATIEMAMYKHSLDRKLKESEERNRSIVEALPGILFHFSADGRFIDCQFNAGDLLLLPPDQIIGKQVAEILPPDLAHLTERMIRETLDSGQLQIFVYSLTLQDQEHFFEARMITSGTNSVLAFVYDINERKRAEDALHESEQKYRDIFKNSVTGLFKTTPDGSLIDVNDAFARLYGHSSAAEMLDDSKAGKHLYISSHLYANPEERKEIHQILAEKGKIENYETLHTKRDGTHLWVSITARTIRDAEGTVLFYEGTVIDITKRKKAEDALKKSQIQLAEAMDLAHLVNWEFDVASGIFTFDDRFYALYGTTPELEGGNQMPADVYTKKFVHPDDQYLVADEVNKAIQATDPLYVSHVEHRIIRRNGEIRHIVVRIGITKDEKGRTIKTNGANQDITERKLAEAALAESEERFRLLLQHVPSISVQGYSMDGTTHYWNDASESLYGYTAQEAVGKNLVDLVIPPEMKDDVRKAMTYMAETGQPIPASELSLMRKDGSRVAVFSSHAVVKSSQGGTELFCIDIDLTERKRAEEALQESEEKFRLISESSPDHIFIQDSKLRYIWVLNPQLDLMPEDMIGKTDYDFLSKEDADLLAPVKRLVLETGKTIPYETSITSSLGETEYFEGVYLPKYDNEGWIDGVMGYFRNITGRKRGEDALKKSEERYHNVIEDQNEFICRFLPDGTHIFVNDAYCRYFNRKREDILGHRFRPVLHPEDREIVARHIDSITPEHPVIEIDQRIVMPDGGLRWQRWSDRAIFDPNGRVIEYQSVGRDITEQKVAEDALQVANKKLKLLSSITRHDVSNQLTILRGYLALLETKQPDPSENEYFRKLTDASQRISDMIRFTKEYEVIGVRAPAWQDCRTLVDTAAKQAPLGQVIVKNDLPAGMEFLADPLIVRVFFNLMDNAVRYGGKITTVRFSALESGDTHLVVCKDDGDGVPADEKEKIFERGFGKHTGMGLFLSREVLSITGITIRETGEPGKGAQFEIVAPKGMWRMNRGADDAPGKRP